MLVAIHAGEFASGTSSAAAGSAIPVAAAALAPRVLYAPTIAVTGTATARARVDPPGAHDVFPDALGLAIEGLGTPPGMTRRNDFADRGQ